MENIKGDSKYDYSKQMQTLSQRTLTYFIRGNITVQLTSYLTGLDSAVLLN